MQNLPEILKIVEGGIRRDVPKVLRYVELLCAKLQAEGDVRSADLLRQTAGNLAARTLKAADVATRPQIPVDSESRVSVAQVDEYKEEVPLVVSNDAAVQLEEFLTAYGRRGDLQSSGVTSPGHVLLFGPPGCGKTQAAKYLAQRLRVPLVTARLDGLVSSFLGSTSKNIRALFEFVDSMPCLLFLDEFDAIAKMRDDPHELGELKRVVNSLLQNIDLLPPDVSVLAATNHEHLLDPAVWRRFEYHIEFELPNLEVRQALLNIYMPGEFESELIRVVARLTEGCSASDLASICNSIGRNLALEGRRAAGLAEAVKFAGRILSRNPETPAALCMTGATNERIIKFRDFDADIFTYDVISKILGVSTGKISGVLSRRA